MLDLDKPILKVSQVAREINISSDRLRTYDEEKLVAPHRVNNTRLYSYKDVEWLMNLRKLIGKDCLSILGFKEILRLSYSIKENDFRDFVKKQDKNSIWQTIYLMRKNPNYEKLKVFYT